MLITNLSWPSDVNYDFYVSSFVHFWHPPTATLLFSDSFISPFTPLLPVVAQWNDKNEPDIQGVLISWKKVNCVTESVIF